MQGSCVADCGRRHILQPARRVPRRRSGGRSVGLIADPHTISQLLALLAGFIPEGAVLVIGDQVNPLLEQGTKSLGFALIVGLAVSLWGANAATKACSTP